MRSSFHRSRPSSSTPKPSVASMPGVSTLAIYLLLCVAPISALAQTITESVPVGNNPDAIAVNPVTNKIYVANSVGDTVTVIDGATGNVTFLPAGNAPSAVAINTITNKIYVASGGGTDVTVIDGATNAVSSVLVGRQPRSLAVNPATNKIYVASLDAGNVTVIDGATNATTTIAAGTSPRAIAVNPVTNRIYVANYTSNDVTVIDGATNTTSTLAVGANPYAIAVNPVTNQVYVANSGSSNVTVINGATNATSAVTAGNSPFSVAIDTVSNKIYIANYESANVTVIDAATNGTTTVSTGLNPGSIAVDAITNQVYVANQSSENVVAIDGASNTVTGTVAVGSIVTALVVNPITDKIYAANLGTNSFSTNNVAIIDGATNAVTTAPVQTGFDGPVLVSPANNQIYFSGSAGLAVLDVATNNVTTINSYIPSQLALNPVTNKIYALEAGPRTNPLVCGFAVIDGATNATTCMSGSWASLAVDPIQNRIYLYNGQVVTVIDGASNAVLTTVNVPGNYSNEALNGDSIAVNPITNKIYVLSDVVPSAPMGSITFYYAVAVIDGVSDTVTTNVPIILPDSSLPTPQAIAVNSVTNKIYVASSTNPYNSQPVVTNETLTVIDGATNDYVTFPLGPASNYDFPTLAINPITNTIYVTNQGGNLVGGGTYPGSVEIVDGNSLAVTYIPVPSPVNVAVNPTTNKIYAVGGTGPSPILAVIDGVTNTFTSVTNLPGTGRPSQLAINPITNQLYASTSNALIVLTEAQTGPNPLNTTVTPFPGNVTSNASPTFNFTATSTFTPVAPPIQNVYYQLDTTTGPWTPATGTAPNFTGQLADIPLGSHILYFYATDGTDSTDLAISQTTTGAISAYDFTIVKP